MKDYLVALAKVDGQKAKVELETTKTLKLELSSGEITPCYRFICKRYQLSHLHGITIRDQ